MMSSVRLWHSALLFILALVDLSQELESSSSLQVLPANFRIILDDTHGGDNLRLYCRPPPTTNNDSSIKTNVFMHQWRLDGEIIDDAEKEFLSWDKNGNVTLVECFASNSLGTSYAFLNFESSNKTESSSLSVALTYDGEAQKFHCQCDGDCKTIEWIKDGTKLDDGQDSSTLPLLNGTGTYGCLVNEKIYQETFVPPIPTLEQPELKSNVGHTVLLGSNVTLTCRARSQATSTIMWMLDEYPYNCDQDDECVIETENGVSILSYSQTESNGGIYKCLIFDEYNNEASSTYEIFTQDNMPVIFDITADSPQGLQMISNDEMEIMILQGSELYINCQHNGTSLIWSLPLKQQERDINPLSVKEIQLEDQGTYHCTVANPMGKSVQDHINILVIQPARMKNSETLFEIQPKSPLNLKCDAIIDERIQPFIFFEWSHNGVILQHNTSELSIESIEESQNFTCILKSTTNFLNEVSQNWQVIVKLQPQILPTFASKMAILKGSNQQIDCYAQGIPPPTLKIVENSTIEVYPRNVIPQVQPDSYDSHVSFVPTQEGKYQCLAQNQHGNSALALEIVLVEPTQVASGSNNSLVKANAGSQVSLHCNVSVDAKLLPFGVQTEWYKNEDKISDKMNLTIPYLIDREHSGAYWCKVTTSVDSVIMLQTLQVMTELPKIQSPKMNVHRAALGSNVTFNCPITQGIPQPTITWKFNGSTLQSNLQMFSLSNVQGNQEGNYTCLAVNEYGNDQIKVDLQVIKPPLITKGPEDLVMKTEGLVSLPCIVSIDSRIEHNITWLFNQTQPLDHEENGNLLINQVTKVHEGTYTCLVQTAYGQVNQTARLTVLGEPPSFIAKEKNVRAIEGSKAILSCQANGMPFPTVSWKKDNSMLIIGGNVHQSKLGDLQIEDISFMNQGLYTCQASNIYGTIDTLVELEVIRKSAPSDDQDLAQNVVTNLGENVTLHCGIQIDPRLSQETKVTWFLLLNEDKRALNFNLKLNSLKPDLKYRQLYDHSLVIQDLSVEDKGKYLCSVETPFEKLEHSVELSVFGEPPKILSNLEKMTVYQGEALNIACLVKGVPKPSLKWFFNEKPLEKYVKEITQVNENLKESRIFIPQVNKSMHQGVFQCQAANTYGSGVSKFANVSVIQPTKVEIMDQQVNAHAGDDLKLSIKIQVDPSNRITNIKWTKNNESIQVGAEDRVYYGADGSIAIANVQKRHSGLYGCTVSTMHDNSSAVVPVKVFVNPPVIVSDSGNQLLFSGHTATLQCKADGIPTPQLHWKFNNTDAQHSGEEFTIKKAILSDSGTYVCNASNQYGYTSKSMQVVVVHTATLESEYLVNQYSDLILPCYDYQPSINVEVSWRLNGRLLTGSQVLQNGSLHITKMSEAQSGAYSCTASLENGRRSFVQTTVRLKPDIILSQSQRIVAEENDDVFLECLLVPGVQAKRVWQFNGEYEYGRRSSYENQGGLLKIHQVLPSDSGNYTCLAHKKDTLEQDTIQYVLLVQPSIGLEPDVKACRVKDQSVANLKVFKTDNATIGIQWDLPDLFNKSCYEHIALTWWTNATESSFSEMQLPLDQVHMQLSGIEDDLTYFIQVNLVAPLNVLVYGHTLKFNLPDLHFGSLDLEKPSYPATPSTLLVIILAATGVAILMVLVLCICKWMQRRQQPKNRFARKSVIKNGKSYTCCNYSEWCYGQRETDEVFQKTNFNGFDTGMYEAAIINVESSKPKRSSGYAEKMNKDDFMSNLTPQWPEPEEVPMGQQEYDPFIRNTHNVNGGHSTFDPPILRNHHHHRREQHGSKESISSSWSSLFNVPGTSSGTVSIRPNSVAVSNLSSSGSAADYAAKVAFIGNKYRKSNNS